MVWSVMWKESDIDSRGRYIRPRNLYQIQEKERYHPMNKSRRATLEEVSDYFPNGKVKPMFCLEV